MDEISGKDYARTGDGGDWPTYTFTVDASVWSFKPPEPEDLGHEDCSICEAARKLK